MSRTERMRIGVSGPVGVTDLPRGAQQARRLHRSSAARTQAVRWETSGLPSVTDLPDEDRAQAFARARLRASPIAPAARAVEDLPQRGRGGAAHRRASGVHRNSVPARLVRLRRALGVDIGDAEQQANLVALHFWVGRFCHLAQGDFPAFDAIP